MRAAIYARTSDPDQKTADEQIRLGRELCGAKGWVVAYALKDEGEQGEDFERPMYQRVFDLAQRQAIDVVIVWKIDRLARSLAQSVVLEEMLRENGAAIVSLTEPIDTTTPVGRFIFGIIGGASQLENEIRRERIRMGMRRLARDGRWPRPRVPFGYRRTKGSRLLKQTDEQQVLRHVFRVYKRKKSLAETAHALNQKGLLRRGNTWDTVQVRRVLTNEICVGTIKASGTEASHDRLAGVPRRQYQAVRDLLASRARQGKSISEEARLASIETVFDQYFASLEHLDLLDAHQEWRHGTQASPGILLSKRREVKREAKRAAQAASKCWDSARTGPEGE